MFDDAPSATVLWNTFFLPYYASQNRQHDCREDRSQGKQGENKVLRANNKQLDKIKLKDEDLEDVKSFTYLGSIITESGGTEEDVKCRIRKARLAFNTLIPVWNASSISTKTKLRIFTTNVIATLLYGSETSKVTQALSNKLQSFVNKIMSQKDPQNSVARKDK